MIFFQGQSVPDLSEFVAGSHILVESPITDYHSTVVELEDLGWEVRDSLKVLSGVSLNLQFALLRKPFKGSVVQNVLSHETGGLNIDGCRVPLLDGEQPRGSGNAQKNTLTHGDRNALKGGSITPPEGRFPANLILHLTEDIPTRFFYEVSDRNQLIDYLSNLIRSPKEAESP